MASQPVSFWIYIELHPQVVTAEVKDSKDNVNVRNRATLWDHVVLHLAVLARGVGVT
jgi:hypothetical protein